MTQPSTIDLAVNPGVWMSGWESPLATEVIEHLVEVGCRRVVVVIRDPARFDVDRVRSLLDKAGLRAVANIGQVPGEDVSSDERAERERGEARLRRGIDLAQRLGADQLTGVTYATLGKASGPVSSQAFVRTARILGGLADEAASAGIRLSCEVVNRYETAILTTARRSMEFAELSGSPDLALHLDVFHMNIEEDDLIGAVAEALPRLAYLELGQNHRGELRSGHIPLADFLDGALSLGYRGRFGVEAFTARALAPDHASRLAIWRDVLDPDTRIAEEALELLRMAFARQAQPAA